MIGTIISFFAVCYTFLTCAWVSCAVSWYPKERMTEEIQKTDPVEFPIDGILDLHTFNPKEVKALLPHYLEVCSGKGIYEVRVIHGKGTGTLREMVHSILRKIPAVASFKLAGEDAGGWGATIVVLRSISQDEKS